MSKALVILSGGQDSTTCLFWALENFDEVHAITFDYGQRHIIELEAAARVAQIAGIGDRHEFVHLPQGLLRGSSPLTDPTASLEQYESAEQMEEVIGNRRELTFVPMRNALFLTIAANRAEVLGAHLVLGVCQMDNANYDDCRELFIEAARYYIETALGHDHRAGDGINIYTPLMWKTKAETVDLAWELRETGCWRALAYSHTSYDGKYPPTDMNHANVLRAAGFEAAGKPDPLVVRAWREGLMPLPTTPNYSPEAFRAVGMETI